MLGAGGAWERYGNGYDGRLAGAKGQIDKCGWGHY